MPVRHDIARPGQARQAQIEQIEALERLVLYRPHLYGASHLEAFQKPRRKADRLPHGAGQANRLADAAGSRQPAPAAVGLLRRQRIAGTRSEPIARSARFDADAFLFVDYPGYGGLCSGKPSPRSIRENVKESVLAAAKQTGIDPRDLPDKGCVFGHSLGCAAALLAVEEFHLRAVVLCALSPAPRTWRNCDSGFPKHFPFSIPSTTAPACRNCAKPRPRPVLHGDKDTIIPVDMSRTLAKEFKDTVDLHVIPGGTHNVFDRGRKELFESMTLRGPCPAAESENEAHPTDR